jgi:mono/diheme cytochrome c family protein
MQKSFDFFPTVTSRIYAGIFFFTGIMILIAWAAINEESRMEEFTQRFEGRSIENGASLFESNCAECHGPNGYGLVGAGPALNNPEMFGYNFLESYNTRLDELNEELESLNAQVNPAHQERIDEIQAEIREVEAAKRDRREDIVYNYLDPSPAVDSPYEEARQALLEARENTVETLLNIDEETREQFNISVPDPTAEDYEEQLESITANRVSFFAQSVRTQAEAVQMEYNELSASIEAAEEAGETVSEADLERQEELNTQISELTDLADSIEAAANNLSSPESRFNRFEDLRNAHQQVQELREEQAAIEEQIDALDPEASNYEGQLQTLEENVSELDTQIREAEAARDEARDALIEFGDIVPYDPIVLDANDNEVPPDRLRDTEWQGTLGDFVQTTLISGRPTSASYWPNPMAAWSQEAGGPLRLDQINNLTNFILNWERDFTQQDLWNINQYAIVPSAGGGGLEGEAVGSDVPTIVEQISEGMASGELVPDPAAGEIAYNSADLGCAGCHVVGGGGAGPDPTGVAWRAENVHVGETYGDVFIETGDHYLVQSIVRTNDFIVEGFNENVMPANFDERLTLQTLADIVAYLKQNYSTPAE